MQTFLTKATCLLCREFLSYANFSNKDHLSALWNLTEDQICIYVFVYVYMYTDRTLQIEWQLVYNKPLAQCFV